MGEPGGPDLHREELLRRLDRAGLVDYQRALAALQDRAHTGKTAEEALVSAGLVSEITLTRLVADSYRIPFLSLADRYVAPEIARLVPRDVAENYALLPIEREGETLTLAMADPMDLMAEDLVRFMTSCQIRRVMVPRSELLQALSAAYDGGSWPLGSSEDSGSSQVELRGEGALETVGPGLATALILEGLREGAGALHFEPRESGLSVRFRIDGRLQKSVDLGLEQRAAVLAELRRLTDFVAADGSAPRLGRCQIRTPEVEAELTVSSVPCLHGHKVVLRLLDRARQAPNLERLGFLPETFRQVVSLLERPSGLILVTGPAGSGRTSTSYGMLHHLGPQGRSIVALEDSWMPEVPGITCIPVGTEPGTMDLRQALEGALLQDPDVLLLRGLPDRETTDLVLRAAGEMLVITTMGAEGALAAVQSLQRLASSPWRAVSTLLGVVAQRRVRRLCESCREEAPPGEESEFSLPPHLKLPERRFLGRGCRACSYSGYRDRVGLQEVLLVGGRLRHLLWSGASEQRLVEAALAEGMVPLTADGLAKVGVGLTSLEEVLRALPPIPGGGRLCSTCRRELAEDFQVCPYCDPGLDHQCPTCQRPVQEDWRTCPFCRRALPGGWEDLPAAREGSPPELPALPGLQTVLVADHDASVRAGILEALERSGYRVLLADDGQDAVDLIAQESPDLVLAEARLPRVDGLELCRRTRQMGRNTPILLLHPRPDAEIRQKILDAGGDGLLSRAVGTTGWVRALVRALEERPARLEEP